MKIGSPQQAWSLGMITSTPIFFRTSTTASPIVAVEIVGGAAVEIEDPRLHLPLGLDDFGNRRGKGLGVEGRDPRHVERARR